MIFCFLEMGFQSSGFSLAFRAVQRLLTPFCCWFVVFDHSCLFFIFIYYYYIFFYEPMELTKFKLLCLLPYILYLIIIKFPLLFVIFSVVTSYVLFASETRCYKRFKPCHGWQFYTTLEFFLKKSFEGSAIYNGALNVKALDEL